MILGLPNDIVDF